MQKRIYLLVIAFGLLASQQLVAQSYGVYFYADALGHSDISSVERSDLEALDGEFIAVSSCFQNRGVWLPANARW